MLRTAPVLRVGIALSSAKEGTALSIGAVVASAENITVNEHQSTILKAFVNDKKAVTW